MDSASINRPAQNGHCLNQQARTKRTLPATNRPAQNAHCLEQTEVRGSQLLPQPQPVQVPDIYDCAKYDAIHNRHLLRGEVSTLKQVGACGGLHCPLSVHHAPCCACATRLPMHAAMLHLLAGWLAGRLSRHGGKLLPSTPFICFSNKPCRPT
eukprot:353843-Chlamydomonas_euryale.AAC.4